MSTLFAMFITVMVLGMLVSYHLGYAAGRREGFQSGHDEGKKEEATRSYAVGYDRGRHDREVAGKPDSAPSSRSLWDWRMPLWGAAMVIILTVLAAAVLHSDKFRAERGKSIKVPSGRKVGFK